MGTRGAIAFVCDGVEKVTYNHFDSYPSGLGMVMLGWLRHADLDATREAVRNLRMVDDTTEPGDQEWEAAWLSARYGNPGVSTGSDWYSLLRETQGNPDAILDAGVAGDASGFPQDSLFCEWAYVVDLDSETFEVYEGFQRSGPVTGRWSHCGPEDGYWPVSLLRSWPLSEVRDLDPSVMDKLES